MAAASEAVLSHPALWRGNECASVSIPSVPSSFTELDMLLPGGGWPREALTEIYFERPGIGELQLVMPALARLTQNEACLALIAPPYIPYAPALVRHGVRLSHLMLIRPQTVEAQFWAAEQVLRSGSCGAMLFWVSRFTERALRRLQFAAEGSGALVMLFRMPRAMPFASAALRLHVSKAHSRTIVRILKRRGGGIPAPVVLDLHGVAARRFAPSARPVVEQSCPLPAAR